MTALDKVSLSAEAARSLVPEALMPLDYIAENLLFCSKDKVEDLTLFAPDLTPEDVAYHYNKMQATYVGREVRVSVRAWNAWVSEGQGKKIETRRMSKKAVLHLAKAKK